jgi:dolichyl-phosphate-mannose--protein O-mannosyl transferase
MKHPMAFWENDRAGQESKQVILLLGNPIVWWGALLGVLSAFAWLLRGARPASQRFALGFLCGGFAINFVPFMFIHRLMYLYHYLFALVFAVLAAAYWSGSVAGWNDDDTRLFEFGSRRSARIYCGVIALVVASFVYFVPFTYGWTVSQTAFDRRFWVLHPRL